MCVSSTRNTESWSESTTSSSRQTFLPSAPSARMKASSESPSIFRARRAMTSISGILMLALGLSASLIALSAMLTA